MGILNVTPDSFSDGGQFQNIQAAVARGIDLVEQGADFLDVGGESTRPYSTPVAADEELQRVVPVIQELSRTVKVPISIDTTKANVARAALEAGAEIVNDISGLTFDAEMPAVCAAADAGVVCMHIRGTPQTMQDDPQYDDVVAEVIEFLNGRIAALEQQGIRRDRIVLDPGIGFGKTAAHNIELLSHVGELRSLDRPVLVGHSRKGFLAKVLGRPVDERINGTMGISVALAAQHTDILRIHDVRAVRDALWAWRAVAERVP